VILRSDKEDRGIQRECPERNVSCLTFRIEKNQEDFVADSVREPSKNEKGTSTQAEKRKAPSPYDQEGGASTCRTVGGAAGDGEKVERGGLSRGGQTTARRIMMCKNQGDSKK